MAANTVSLSEDQLSCSLCLELLRDPTTIPCGHTYCLSCIQLFWDSPRLRDGVCCPQCRASFDPRPLLSKNIVLEEVLQKLQEVVPTRTQSLLHSRKLRQSNSNPSQLNKVKDSSLDDLKESEKELRFSIRFVKHSTDAVVEESQRVFSKLIRSLEKMSQEVKQRIRAKEQQVLSRAEDELKKIQSQIQTLQRRSGSEENLLLPQVKDAPFPVNMDQLPYVMLKNLRAALGDVKETLNLEYRRISNKVLSMKEYDMSTSEVKDRDGHRHNTAPLIRANLHHSDSSITLDPHTANCYLRLSEDLKEATTLSAPHSYPDRPERFTNWAQVLGGVGMTGKSYWEVEWEGSVCMGVCYSTMRRSGSGIDSKLGHNRRSWSLDVSAGSCSFHHHKLSVSVTSCSRRVGVGLDFSAGTLSFYDVRDSMKLLHKVQSSFTEPLYPAFWVGLGSTIRLFSQ